VRCAGCETQLRSNARFCDNCGCEVATPQTEETRPVSHPVAESFWYSSPPTSTAPGPSSGAAREKTERLRVPNPATTSAVDKVAAARVGIVAPDAAKTEATPLKRTKSDTVYREKALKSAFVDTRTSPSVRPQRRRYPILAAAAVLVATVLGVGAYTLRQRGEPVLAPAETSAMPVATIPVTEVADTEDRTVRKFQRATTSSASQDRESTAMAPPNTSTPSRPKPPTPTTPSGSAVSAAAKLSGAQNSTREGSAVPNTSAPPIAVHEADVAAIVPTPATPETPVAPFFETKDVNESPRIETRVEPKVPDALKARSSSEIVVVRALVSQSGRPSRVSLLRRTKAGPELDTVVVEAVNRWTFAPATKKGKAVSCWFNFGVQVRPAE